MRTTNEFVRQYWPFAVLAGGAISWAALIFERHIRADQHEQDMAMFHEWIATHIRDVHADTVKAEH